MMTFSDFKVGQIIRQMDLQKVLRSGRFSKFTKEAAKKLVSSSPPEAVLYYYNSERDLWDQGVGSEGFVTVVGDEIVGNHVWRMN